MLFLLACPPVCTVCTNHEVVVFQPCTGTALYLGSVAIFTTIIDSYRLTCFNRFWVSRPPPPGPDPYRSSIFHPSILLHSLVAPTSIPPTRPGIKRPSTWMYPQPAGLHHLSALPSIARRPQVVPFASLCLPSLICPPPLFAILELRPGTCQIQGFYRPRLPPPLCLPPYPARLPPPPPLTASTGIPVP